MWITVVHTATVHWMVSIYVLQVGRSLYLLGKHRAAKELYDEAERVQPDDWEIANGKGQCYSYLRSYDLAVEALVRYTV